MSVYKFSNYDGGKMKDKKNPYIKPELVSQGNLNDITKVDPDMQPLIIGSDVF